MRTMVRVAIALLLLFVLVPSAARAEARIALVITNQAYTQPGARLTNTHRDGDVVKAALEKVGFKVWVAKDTTNERSLLEAVAQHVQRLAEAGPDAVGFFYYSGHGAADRPNGENFLIPTDVPLTHVAQLPLLAVRLEKITSTLATAGRMSFVVFDACRNVPLQRADKDLAFKGFAPVREQNGLLVAFATEPGNVAVDQSLYAKALAEELIKPGLEAAQIFRRVRARVREDTRQTQSPEYLDKRDHDFHFQRVPSAPAQPQISEAERTWAWIKDTNNQVVLENFIKQFGDTPFGEMAKAQLAELRKQQVAVAVSPNAPPAPSPALATPPDVVPAGRWLIQFSVQKTRAEVITSASALQKKHSQALAGTSLGIEEANNSVLGFVYRGLIGPPMSLDAANRVCKNLKTAGETCTVRATDTAFIALGAAELQTACDGVETLVGNEKSCLKPKDTFKDCDACPEMVVVPAGEFMMGSPKNEEHRQKEEDPQHKVTIGKPFAVGKFAVTRDQFEAFVRETSHATGNTCETFENDKWEERAGRSFRNPGFAQDGKHPVVCVNWDDAKTFVAWLSKKTGKDYRLLSEAEREYVARAGTTTAFWWEASISTSRANYDGNYTYDGGAKAEWRKKTLPVDSFEANPWGLYQVHGNVWEWVEDCWNDTYQGAPASGSAWTSGNCGRRVVRGGSWTNPSGGLRAAVRSRSPAVIRTSIQGFRLARTLSP
jgi:formylglycine-generating enzyme required for sulfatase activity/uncharacterized caspase-like protein